MYEGWLISSALKASIFTFLLFTLNGCSIVRIYGADGVVVQTEYGISQISITPSLNPSYIATEGVGIIAGRRHLIAGWMKEKIALFPDPARCAALLLVSSTADVEAVQKLLEVNGRNLQDVCLVKGT